MSGIKAKLRKYFSGKMVLVQITGGVGALAGRSLAAYLALNEETWVIVMVTQLGSFAGYISAYALGYWFTFRRDYRMSGRSMVKDVFRLQLVEQSPNVGTVISSALTQAALMTGGGVNPVISATLASWFGPHKIANLAAMGTSNSLKRGWVDGAWRPGESLHRLGKRVAHICGKPLSFRRKEEEEEHLLEKVDASGHEIIR